MYTFDPQTPLRSSSLGQVPIPDENAVPNANGNAAKITPGLAPARDCRHWWRNRMNSAKKLQPVTPSPAASPTSKRRRKNLAERLEEQREQLWPDSCDEIWCRKQNDGFSTVPRVLSLVAALLKQLTKGNDGDPTSVYMELWCRATDQGIVQITDESECAFAAGYTGTRSLRTWNERMAVLVEFGVIKVAQSGNRKCAYVLLVNPLLAAARLRNNRKYKVPQEWWTAFTARAQQIGAVIPSDL